MVRKCYLLVLSICILGVVAASLAHGQQNCVTDCKNVSCYRYYSFVVEKYVCRLFTEFNAKDGKYPPIEHCFDTSPLHVLKPDGGNCTKADPEVTFRVWYIGTNCQATCPAGQDPEEAANCTGPGSYKYSLRQYQCVKGS